MSSVERKWVSLAWAEQDRLLAEYLGRLGVGNFVLADPAESPSRICHDFTGATLSGSAPPGSPPIRSLLGCAVSLYALQRRRSPWRVATFCADPRAKIDTILGDFLEEEIATDFIDCDYLFLAADSMRARLLFNAIVHQYLVPGVQGGAKVQVDKTTGEVVDVFSVVRPVTSESGRLLCNRLINSAKLQERKHLEGREKGQRSRSAGGFATSVITLNAVAVSHASDDFLFYMTGLKDPNAPTA